MGRGVAGTSPVGLLTYHAQLHVDFVCADDLRADVMHDAMVRCGSMYVSSCYIHMILDMCSTASDQG